MNYVPLLNKNVIIWVKNSRYTGKLISYSTHYIRLDDAAISSESGYNTFLNPIYINVFSIDAYSESV